MSDVMGGDAMPVLYGEHALLGASLADDGLAVPVIDYGDVAGEADALRVGGHACLCDMSGMLVQLVEGGSSAALIHAACAGPQVSQGAASFGVVLTGDGGVVSVPLVACTGACEHVLFDATRRADMLAAWLGFLTGVERDGLAPYADVTITDATDVHVPLLIAGDAASAVLADYVGGGGLPAEGRLGSVMLDGHLRCICLRLPVGDAVAGACYLLLVAPAYARVLWRSLLSFRSVVPIGRTALHAVLADALPWWERMDSPDRCVIVRDDLSRWGLLREGGDYVGARALGEA